MSWSESPKDNGRGMTTQTFLFVLMISLIAFMVYYIQSNKNYIQHPTRTIAV